MTTAVSTQPASAEVRPPAAAVGPHSLPARPELALNRLTLCFRDAHTERDFRLTRAEASRPVLRRFVLVMVTLVCFIIFGIGHKLELARRAGVPLPSQLTHVGAEGFLFGGCLATILFIATLSRRWVPWLHTITMMCMAGFIVVDHWHAWHIPPEFALTGIIINLVVVYVASQLRFASAALLGMASSMLHLCSIGARGLAGQASEAEFHLQMGVAFTVLVCANVVLMFVTHQRELSARLAYYRARQLEHRGQALESALSHLKDAELKLVETEKQAVAGRLVAGLLHELNTPLGALSSATQTLESSVARLSSQQTGDGTALREAAAPRAEGEPAALPDARWLAAARRLIGVQANSTQRIRQVVEGLRQFVSLDQAELQVVDVRVGLRTAVALMQPELPAAVRLSVNVPDTPVWVHCFPAKLNQVFLNLLKNAVSACVAKKDAKESSVHVGVSVQGQQLCIEVADTGIGIPKERLQRIFDLGFSRAGERVKLGLGLPASRSVVEELGGTLEISSEPGKGTRARLLLPMALQAPGPARAELAKRAAPEKMQSGVLLRSIPEPAQAAPEAQATPARPSQPTAAAAGRPSLP